MPDPHTGIQRQYSDITNGKCKAFEGNPANDSPQAIVCNGTFTVSEYTMAHEVGHLIDYRSGNYIYNSIGGSTTSSNFDLGSCATVEFGTNYTVMGKVNGDWRRGERGWGSGPSSTITNFQQNPSSVNIVEIREAAADMLLNWFYRSTSPGNVVSINGVSTSGTPPSTGCIPISSQTTPTPVPQTWAWEGFQNVNWPVSRSSAIDWGFPGDVRHVLMQNMMTSVLALNPSW